MEALLPRFFNLPLITLFYYSSYFIGESVFVVAVATSAKCPFAARCVCGRSNEPDATPMTFASATCDFGIAAPTLTLSVRHGKYHIEGELIISGKFKDGFNIVGDKPFADVFESIGRLILRNTNRTASFSQNVKPTPVSLIPAKALTIDGFRAFTEAFQWCGSKCWAQVESLTFVNSKINDYATTGDGLFGNTFPALTSLTFENTQVQSLDSMAEDSLKDRLIELHLIRCTWKKYPALEYFTALTKLTLQNSIIPRTDDDGAAAGTCAFCGLPALEELNLASTDVAYAVQIKAFEELPKTLTTVILSGKGLTKIPYKLTQNNVKHLSISNDQIKVIKQDNFHIYNQLQYLAIDHTELNSIEPVAFEPLTKLEELVLTATQLHEFDLSTLSAEMTSLKSLALDENKVLSKITISSTEQVPPNLERISLTGVSVKRIPEEPFKALLDSPAFQTLDISNSVITLCEEAKWLVPYTSMCNGEEHANNKLVYNENTKCGNAAGKPFQAFMEKRAKRNCQAPAEADADPADDEVSDRDVDVAAAAGDESGESDDGGVKMKLIQVLSNNLNSLGETTAIKKVKICLGFKSSADGQCSGMNALLQQCLALMKEGGKCSKEMMQKLMRGFMSPPTKRARSAVAAAAREVPTPEEPPTEEEGDVPAASPVDQMKLKLSQILSQDLKKQGKTEVSQKVRMCVSFKSEDGTCPFMTEKANTMLQQCLAAMKRKRECPVGMRQKLAAYMIEAFGKAKKAAAKANADRKRANKKKPGGQ